MSPHTTWAAVGKCGKLLFARGKVMNALIKYTREFFFRMLPNEGNTNHIFNKQQY